jgi:hypothetical protein
MKLAQRVHIGKVNNNASVTANVGNGVCVKLDAAIFRVIKFENFRSQNTQIIKVLENK